MLKNCSNRKFLALFICSPVQISILKKSRLMIEPLKAFSCKYTSSIISYEPCAYSKTVCFPSSSCTSVVILNTYVELLDNFVTVRLKMLNLHSKLQAHLTFQLLCSCFILYHAPVDAVSTKFK